MLALVIGPSGAGKDTLLAGARSALAGDTRFVFARRILTRANSDGIEQHECMGESVFREAESAGRFLLSWQAHATSYAIPTTFGEDLSRGHVVVANVSRTVISRACQLVANVAVIHVTASRAVLAARLADRGREDERAISARLDRSVAIAFGRAPLVEIINEGTVEIGVRSLTQALSRLADHQPAGCVE